jgi:hypothetical protein
MDEKLVRKALRALEGQERQRDAAIEVLARHLTNDTANCEETVNRLFDVLDSEPAIEKARQAEQAREELEAALDDDGEDKGSRRDLHLASYH